MTESGELSKDINVDDYTRYLSSILAGLSIQATNGSTKANSRGPRGWRFGTWVMCSSPGYSELRAEALQFPDSREPARQWLQVDS
jgi:hypothetical protein